MNQLKREQALDNFVSREVYACQSSLIEEGLKQNLFSVDEIDNLYRPFDGKLIDPSICVRCEQKSVFLDSETGECEECFEQSQEPQEIFEWWLVSPWFGKRLLIEGEPIIDNDYGIWWGRCTTGQAISMDDIIERVCDGILSYTE